jgi:hypothetical protein
MVSFKEENRALQELVRELGVLRSHNLRFGPYDPQGTLLLFAESALVNIILEHFVRSVVGSDAPDDAALFNLLQISISKKLLLLPCDDQQKGIDEICDFRNATLHGNYAQAALDAGSASVREYFRTKFALATERMTLVLDSLMKQINPETGKRYTPL